MRNVVASVLVKYHKAWHVPKGQGTCKDDSDGPLVIKGNDGVADLNLVPDVFLMPMSGFKVKCAREANMLPRLGLIACSISTLDTTYYFINKCKCDWHIGRIHRWDDCKRNI